MADGWRDVTDPTGCPQESIAPGRRAVYEGVSKLSGCVDAAGRDLSEGRCTTVCASRPISNYCNVDVLTSW